jgi:exosortase E/protease (VPEID-CTERM system)
MSTQALVQGQIEYVAPSQAGVPNAPSHLPLRLTLAAFAVTAELCFVAALGHPWVHTLQIATAPIVFFASLLFFGRARLRSARADNILRLQPRAVSFVLWHCAALVAMLALDIELHIAFAHHGSVSSIGFAAWCVALVAMAFTLIASILQPDSLVAVARGLGVTWIYAAVCAVLASAFRLIEYVAWDAPSSWLGNHLAGHAFSGVKFLLDLFYTNISANPVTRILGTPAFRIHVAGTCSGIEGLGLTLALTLGWIVYERRQLRIARTLLLTPIALLLMWGLNLVRMTALVAIGLAGHPALALTGFHTEAGWVAFTLVAIGFLLAASRVDWFQKTSTAAASTSPLGERAGLPPATIFLVQKSEVVENPSVEYLVPFVALLSTSLITRAFSTTGFEVLYPLRLLVVAAVLFVLRKQLFRIYWVARPRDIFAGAAVGLVWIVIARHADGSLIAAGLHTLSPGVRNLWIICRTVSAVVCVPLVEELAFRGFLSRWLVDERFDNVRYAALTLTSIAISSVAFGLMHGHLWIMGAISGAVFAVLAKRSDSLGSAVVAHATANLVLAVVAITYGAYGLW